jgi:DNA end-binding protein Ku
MRPIWKGAISFGMVTIPVKLYTATEQKDVRFRLLHAKDGAPIREQRICTRDGEEVEWKDLVRGYEVAKGEFVVIGPEEIEEVKPESASTIDIGDFVELTEIDPIYFEKSYFLEPTDVGAKPFTLLRRALEETGRVAIARVIIRAKERLATIRGYDGTMILETMFWPDEIRSTGTLDLPEGKSAEVRSKELQMAHSLVENLSDRFRPDEYQDRYRIALQELIERKMAGEKRATKRRKPQPKVVDLMEALEASLAKSREARRPAGRAAKRTARSEKPAKRARSTRKRTRRAA